MKPIIYAKHLNKSYTKYPRYSNLLKTIKALLFKDHLYISALQDVSFKIFKGEKVALLGPNGSGKSTTMKLLSGIITNTRGEIIVNGFCPQRREKAFLKSIGLLAGQKSNLWWDLPPLDSFKLFKEIYEINNNDYKQRLEFLLANLQVENLVNKQVRKLSLGERMKMELISVLLHMPKVLLLDEPTIGLDYKSQQSIIDILNKYNKEFNISIILTSHYLKDIENLCDRVIILDKGNVIFDDRLSNLKKRYACHLNLKIIANKELKIDLFKPYAEEITENNKNYILKIESRNLEKILKAIKGEDITEFLIEEPSVEEALNELFYVNNRGIIE